MFNRIVQIWVAICAVLAFIDIAVKRYDLIRRLWEAVPSMSDFVDWLPSLW